MSAEPFRPHACLPDGEAPVLAADAGDLVQDRTGVKTRIQRVVLGFA